MPLTPRTKKLLRPAIILAISALAFSLALLLTHLSNHRADDFFYDTFYRLRPTHDMRFADPVLVAVDQPSLTAAKKGWPWPRAYWADIVTYLDHAGAKAIVFDIVFPEPSVYGDDDAFAAAINSIKTPVIFGSAVKDTGDWEPFAPPIKNPTFGAVNLANDKIYRAYPPELNGQPSLAEAAVLATTPLDQLLPGTHSLLTEHPDQPFLLHYYGPHLKPNGKTTFRFVPAYAVLAAQHASTSPSTSPAPPQTADTVSTVMFRDKIVIICAIALGTFDLKSSPLSDEFPGPEVQATAIENLLHSQQVHPVAIPYAILSAALLTLLVSAAIIIPRKAALKLLLPLLLTTVFLATCILLFRNPTIHWLTPVPALLSLLIASPLSFGYTYFSEDRQRRFMLKALSKVVSPAVAHQLSQNPERLALGTTRAQITVLFSDLANFTDLSEGMDVQDLGKLINRYLGEMSTQVFNQDGTLDKYIGDAVMAFWNAPLPQSDHALRACRAALHMIAREKQLHAEFTALGTRRIHTRIGIHTATVAVGFIGSEHLFNYTAMGDGVNLGSRMEGANKLYDTQILISESTAALVRDHFHIRRMDILRVKGKKQPMPVYELLAEKSPLTPAPPNPNLESQIHLYESALTAYQSRDWTTAEAHLLELSTRFGQNGPVETLLARIRNYRDQPPPPDWDGVYISTTK